MSSEDAPATPQTALSAEDIADRSFPNAFRGFDPVEVRSFLGRVADELRLLAEREHELQARLESAIAAADTDRATDAAATTVAAAREEADRLVRDAKERVTQLGSAATSESARVMEEARANAQQLVRSKRDEAEATAVKKIADAEREAAAIRVKAREDADAILEAAKERGREMLAEAQAARERLIADITKRKRAASAQLDQLRAGRDRLLESLRVVRRNLDEITTRLEATEGAGAPPVAVTPPAAEANDKADAAAAGASEPRRQPRTSRVMLGELPPQRPPERPAAKIITTPRETESRDQESREAESAPAATIGDDSADIAPAPAPTEERRSSALRILRRHRNPAARAEPAVPPRVGRDSSSEGIRIIPAEPTPAAEAPAAPAVETIEVEVEAADVAVAADLDADVAVDAPVEVELDPDVGPTAVEGDVAERESQVPDVLPEDLPPPLRPEELRPRIEDLFARLRADRETAIAKARDVLSTDHEPIDEAAARDVETAEQAEAPEEIVDATSADADEHALQTRDAAIDPIVAQLSRKLKRAIQDEQNSSLDKLRTAKPRPAADAVLPSPDTQPAAYRYAALPLLEEVARAASAAAPFGAVAVGVDDLAQALADDIAGQIRERVDRVLADGQVEDLDVQATSERVSSVYREWKTQRVERLAAHYLVAAWSRGTFIATPEGTALRWIVDDDGPCPDCDDNALAGPTPRGNAFPTGQLHPPAHVGCRCLLAVVAD